MINRVARILIYIYKNVTIHKWAKLWVTTFGTWSFLGYFLLLQHEEIDSFGLLKSITTLSSSDSEFNKARLSTVTIPQKHFIKHLISLITIF